MDQNSLLLKEWNILSDESLWDCGNLWKGKSLIVSSSLIGVWYYCPWRRSCPEAVMMKGDDFLPLTPGIIKMSEFIAMESIMAAKHHQFTCSSCTRCISLLLSWCRNCLGAGSCANYGCCTLRSAGCESWPGEEQTRLYKWDSFRQHVIKWPDKWGLIWVMIRFYVLLQGLIS